METTFAKKLHPQKKVQPAVETTAARGKSLTQSRGAGAGLPLFLQRSAMDRQAVEKEEPEEQEEVIQQAPLDLGMEEEEPNQNEDNEAEESSIQTKLVIGEPGDQYEQEADQVAQAVTQPDAGSAQTIPLQKMKSDRLQRLCDNCEKELTQQDEEEESGRVQRKLSGSNAGQKHLTSRLTIPDAGFPIPPHVLKQVEPKLGADLSDVRVHTSPSAQQTAKDLNAKAFTHKQHIWLGTGQSADDVGLMAHEATHVVQQTVATDGSTLVQRKADNTETVEDGSEVSRRLQQRIDEALGIKSSTTLAETPTIPTDKSSSDSTSPASATAAANPEAKQAAEKVDRSKLAAKTAEVQPDACPPVDRAAEQQPQVEAAAKETATASDKPPEQKAEGKAKAEPKGEEGQAKGGAGKAAVAAADQAAGLVDQAFALADSQSLPDQLAEVVPPTPVAPVDAGGMPLPDNPEMDAQLFDLANQAQELREQGQNQRAHATEGTANTQILRGNLKLVQQSIGKSESSVQTAQGHLEFRRGLVSQAQQALTVSEQKATNLTQQAPRGVSEAARGKEKSGPLASESRDLVGKNQANTPNDPEAAKKSQEQGSKLNQVGSDAASIDDTLTQVHSASNTLVQDAAHATQVNTQTRGRVDGMEATLQQTDARLSVMQEQNSQASSQLNAAQEQPALLQAEASGMDAEGQDMIATSLDIEQRIHQAQQNHAAGVQSVPAVTPPEEETQATPIEELSPEPSVVEPSAPLEESQTLVAAPQAAEELSVAAIQAPETAPIPAESAPEEEAVIQRQVAETAAPQPAEATPPQPSNINIAKGLPSWLTGEPEPNAAERLAAQEQEEQRRQKEIEEINAIASEKGGFDKLSAAERRRIAFRLSMRNTFGGISNISWPGLGGIAKGAGHLAAGLIDPRAPLMGVVSGINMIVNGVVNFGRQPSWIGALRLAATVATGLTIILGSVTALAGVIAAIMVAISILSLGTAAPITGPVIAFCATIMTTVGGWTFWVGLIAAALQALTFVADLWQAGTAQTADQLQQQSETMTEDTRNAGNALMQAGMGKLAQVGGRAMQSQIRAAGGGVRFAARLGARGPVGSVVSGVRRAGLVGYGKEVGRQIVSGAKALPGRIVGGAKALRTAAKALPSRIVGGARALRTAAKALPGRIVQAPGQFVKWVRSVPGRLRQYMLESGSIVREELETGGVIKPSPMHADRPLEPVVPYKSTRGHGHAEHGSGTTMAQQENRIRTGTTPSGSPGRPPSSASRFGSPELETEALYKGRQQLNADLRSGSVPKYTTNPQTGVAEPTRHAVTVSCSDPTGFGQSVARAKNAAGQAIRDPITNQYIPVVDPTPLRTAKIIYEYVPSINEWRPVTYFPQP